MKIAILLMFLAVATVSGDDTHSLTYTAGFRNGRAWRDMPDPEKLGFVMGFSEGIKLPLLDNEREKERAAYFKAYLGKSQLGETIAGVDDFYRDPANVQIQVIAAMLYFQEKVTGASPESLAKELAEDRKFAADHVGLLK